MNEGQVDVGAFIPSDWGDVQGEGRTLILPVAGQESEATIIRQIFDTFAETANAIAVSTEILMTEAAVRSAAGEEIDMQALHEGLSSFDAVGSQ